MSSPNEYPSSPAERYVAIRAQMIYDANSQQPNTTIGRPVSQTSTTGSAYLQQLRSPLTTTFSAQSLGFQMPQAANMKSKLEQPTNLLQPEPITPSQLQPASASRISTADYPMVTSSMISSPTYCTQMSHDQTMQVWRQDQIDKIQKKQRHCYVYGVPAQPSVIDRVSTATILTPQILFTTIQQQAPSTSDGGRTRRQPTISPFLFRNEPNLMGNVPSSITSAEQSKPRKKRNLKINRPQLQPPPIPPLRMDRPDENS